MGHRYVTNIIVTSMLYVGSSVADDVWMPCRHVQPFFSAKCQSQAIFQGRNGGMSGPFTRSMHAKLIWLLKLAQRKCLCSQMVLLRELKPGERVCISYGDLPNDFLLLDYGAALSWVALFRMSFDLFTLTPVPSDEGPSRWSTRCC